MPTITITKVSGVLFLRNSDNTNAKSYFGATGKYLISDDNTTIQIFIGGDIYSLTWQNLRVGTSTPTSISQAATLLNAIFGT